MNGRRAVVPRVGVAEWKEEPAGPEDYRDARQVLVRQLARLSAPMPAVSLAVAESEFLTPAQKWAKAEASGAQRLAVGWEEVLAVSAQPPVQAEASEFESEPAA